MRTAFKLISVFWILSPAMFLIGRWLGIWNFEKDVFCLTFLLIMMSISLYLNYDGK